jgi:Cof subfamily protein (haloacid dehalogenase superfamily)
MAYKLIALDVDGTLLNDDKIITERMKATLIKVQQMGIALALASGRPTAGVVPLAKELEMDFYGGFVLSYNGGQIINMKDNELLFDKRVNRRMLPYLARKANKLGFDMFTYRKNIIYTNNASNEYIVREAELNNMRIQQIPDFDEAISFDPCKCMIVSENEQALIALENHWKRRLAGELDVFRSEAYFLEVVPPSIDKANTLSFLLEKQGIERSDVIAIGDGVCDVTMLQLAGLGIAMGNAPESVKACADKVTLSNREDGVAIAIENNVLAEIHPSEISLYNLNEAAKHALMGNLGIQYTYASEERIEATMPVDERTRQPFGILHGGATLALAETVAGLGSLVRCKPDEVMVGMQVSGNHIAAAHEGDTVRAVGTIIHKGRSSHVWNVDVFTSTDRLVSTVRIVNCIIKKR